MIDRRIQWFVKMLHISSYIIFSSVIISCSVKEDRLSCPCILYIDISQIGELSAHMPASISVKSGRYDIRKKTISGYRGESHLSFKLNKGLCKVTAVAGSDNCIVSDMKIVTRDGGDFDPVFVYHSDVECREDYAFDTVRLNKEYAKVDLEFPSGVLDSGRDGIYAHGNVCGFDLEEKRPVSGKFLHKLSGNSSFSFNVPRQTDNSLCLEIILSGQTRMIPVGEYISSQGYDWKDSNLDDIVVRIDSSLQKIEAEVVEWENGYDRNVSI